VLETGETHAHLKYSVELKEKIRQVKDLLSSSRENLTDSELFELLLEDFIERKDPVKKASRAQKRATIHTHSEKSPQRTRAIPAASRHALALTTPRKCQYQDPRTGVVCGSTKKLEADHELPFSKGGRHEPSNLTYLCKSHNLRKADSHSPSARSTGN
jgi:5-methylcytosine-specific restriction endonuclease McrA